MTAENRLALAMAAIGSARSMSQEAPAFVPMFITGSSPGNRRGMIDRIEWQS